VEAIFMHLRGAIQSTLTPVSLVMNFLESSWRYRSTTRAFKWEITAPLNRIWAAGIAGHALREEAIAASASSFLESTSMEECKSI